MEIAALFGQLVANGNSFATIYLRPSISVFNGTQIIGTSTHDVSDNSTATHNIVNKETQSANEDVQISEEQQETSSDDEQNSNDSVSCNDSVEDENCNKNEDNLTVSTTQRIR